jgi:hypothetical protein
MSINGFGGTSSVSNNTISTISGQATITGLLIGAAGTAATQPPFLPIQLIHYFWNRGLVTGLSCANISPVVNIDLNTINGLASSLSIASASVHGVLVTAAVYKYYK